VKNGEKKEENKRKTSNLSNAYTNKVDKKATTPYLLKKKNDKVMAIKVNKHANTRGQTSLGAKRNYFNHEEHQESLDLEGEVRSPMDVGEFGDLAKFGYISWGASH
jgi:hypothetical protein